MVARIFDKQQGWDGQAVQQRPTSTGSQRFLSIRRVPAVWLAVLTKRCVDLRGNKVLLLRVVERGR